MTFTSRFSDGFSLTATLAGAVLDNAGGGSGSNTWTIHNGGTWAEAAGVVAVTAGATTQATVDSFTPTNVLQRASIKAVGSNLGVILGKNLSSGGYYMYYRNNFGDAGHIYKDADGTGNFALLGTGSAVAANDVMTLEWNPVTGDMHAYINGTLDATMGTVNNTAITSGVPGLYGGDGSAVFDNFLFETTASGNSSGTIAGVPSAFADNVTLFSGAGPISGVPAAYGQSTAPAASPVQLMNYLRNRRRRRQH